MCRLIRCGMPSALMLVPYLAVAQAPPPKNDQNATSLEEVVVTAQRRTESLQSVPIAVSAVTAESLADRQITTPQGLQAIIPELKMINNITSPTNLSPSLRGSTQQDASSISAESPFGIYIDDIYIGRLNGNNVALGDIDQIEVLRGPQGTLYGRNTLTGALKFASRTPGRDPWRNFTLGGGNFSQYLASFSAGGPVGENWAASLSGMTDYKGGEWNDVAIKEKRGRERNVAARAKLHYTGLENVDLVAFLSYVRSTNDAIVNIPGTTPGVPGTQSFSNNQVVPTYGYYDVATPRNTGSVPYITPLPEGRTTQTIAGINMSYTFWGVTLRSITGYVNTRDFFSTDLSGAGNIIGASVADANQLSEELHVQGKAFGDRLNYIVGAYLYREIADQNWGWYFFGPASTSHLDITTDSISVFTQADYKLTNSWAVTLGTRWTQDKKKFDDSIVQLTNFGGYLAPVSLHNKYSETTPKFAIDYTIPQTGVIDQMLLYASAAKGFKSGGYNGVNIIDLSAAESAYGPEHNWTYEVGAKTDLCDHRLRMNVAYFYEKAIGLALNATVLINGALTFPVQNAGDANIQGLEMEISAVPVKGLTVFWNPTFESGKYTGLNPTAAPAQAGKNYGVANPRPPQLPWMAFSLGFDYTVDVSFGSMAGRFLVGADWFRTANYVITSTNDNYASPYDRLNGYVGLGFGKSWEVRLAGKNLQNRQTISTGSRALGAFVTLPRREGLLSLNYRY